MKWFLTRNVVIVDETEDAEVGGYKGTTSSFANHVDDPTDKVGEGSDEDSQEPEPNEKVNLLVEHVDHQNALDCMTVLVSKNTDLEVAHGHPGMIYSFTTSLEKSPIYQRKERRRPFALIESV